MSLTPIQQGVIRRMYQSNGICYNDRHDRTMRALGSKGLAHFMHRQKYGRNHWCLTEEGTAQAAKRIAGDTRKGASQ